MALLCSALFNKTIGAVICDVPPKHVLLTDSETSARQRGLLQWRSNFFLANQANAICQVLLFNNAEQQMRHVPTSSKLQQITKQAVVAIPKSGLNFTFHQAQNQEKRWLYTALYQ